MTSTLVNNCFDFAQSKLYGPQVAAIEEKDSEAKTKKEVTITNRLKAVPIALADLTLETLRSVLLVVESAALTAMCALVIPFSLFYGAMQRDYSLARRVMRLTLFNINNTLFNTVHGALKIVTAPLVLLGQIGLLASNPEDKRPSNSMFQVHDDKDINGDVNRYQTTMYLQFNAESAKQTETTTTPPDDESDIGEEEETKATPTDKPTALQSGLKVCTLALKDAGFEVLKPLSTTLVGIAAVVVHLVKQIPTQLWVAFKGDATQKVDLRVTFVDFFKSLSTTSQALAQTVTKIAMAPLTILAQITSGLWDPQKVRPSKLGLYSTDIGDVRVSLKGIERRTTTIYDDADQDWQLLVNSSQKDVEKLEDDVDQDNLYVDDDSNDGNNEIDENFDTASVKNA